MKKIVIYSLFSVVCILGSWTYLAAQSVNDCVSLGLKAELADILCGATSVAGSIIPDTDNSYDLGSASLEFKDSYFDGTVTTDALVSVESTLGSLVVKSTGALESNATNLGLDAASGSNTACDTTCAVSDGACLFGFDAGTTALVDCAAATADTCVCAEPVS